MVNARSRRWHHTVRVVIACAAVGASLGCTALQWGVPRTPLSSVSPDGRFVAYVRNRPNLDPSDQTMWLGRVGGESVRLGAPPPDAWSVTALLWSSDSRRVAFVISDAIVLVFDAETAESVFSGFVGRRTWSTPPAVFLREPSLSADGTSMTFVECERTWVPDDPDRQNDAGSRVRQHAAGCADASVTVAFDDVPADRLWR